MSRTLINAMAGLNEDSVLEEVKALLNQNAQQTVDYCKKYMGV